MVMHLYMPTECCTPRFTSFSTAATMNGRSRSNCILSIVVILFICQESQCDQSAFTVINDCGKMVVTRETWQATAPKSTAKFSSSPEFIIICHTVTPHCYNQSVCSARVSSIQNYHMNHLSWDDIGYNFLIGEDGHVYVGRNWENVGTHTPGYNEKSIGIAFIGQFSDKSPNSSALEAAMKLIKCGAENGKISSDYKLIGHRQAKNTISPGNKLFEIIQHWPHWTSDL